MILNSNFIRLIHKVIRKICNFQIFQNSDKFFDFLLKGTVVVFSSELSMKEGKIPLTKVFLIYINNILKFVFSIVFPRVVSHKRMYLLFKKEIWNTHKLKQIIKYNRWQQRNRPIIHDVPSVKYNKENEIFSCFLRLNKKV